MPLFYFDVADNGILVTDHFGVELDDLYEAREQAIALLPDMARNELPDGDRHEFAAVVRCPEGRVRYEAKLVFQGRWVEPPTYGRASHAFDGSVSGTLAEAVPVEARSATDDAVSPPVSII